MANSTDDKVSDLGGIGVENLGPQPVRSTRRTEKIYNNRKSQPTKDQKAARLMPEDVPLFDNVDDRVDYIIGLMRDFLWVTGKTSKILADKWQLSKATIERYSAEASRQVLANRSEYHRDITTGAMKLFAQAVANNDPKGAAVIAKVLADVTGANAPVKQEITVDSNTINPNKAREAMAAIFAGGVGEPVKGDSSDSSDEQDSAKDVSEDSEPAPE